MLLILIYIFTVFFIGTRMRALGNIMHECSHNIFVSSRGLNRFYGHLIAVLLFECFDNYKKEHFLHHRFLGEQKDPDYIKYQKIKCSVFKNNALNVAVSVLNPYFWFLSLQNISLLHAKNKRVIAFKILYIGLLIFCLSVSLKTFLLFFLVPYLTTYQILKLFSDIVDHDKVYDKKNFLDRARNHIFKRNILNWIIFPRNDAYHLVHHMYPNLPISAYKRQHERLMKNNLNYASKNHSCDLQKF